MLPYERLTAWQVCYTLVLETYRATERFPKEFRRYLDISIGSLSELAFALRLARDLEILPKDDWLRLDELRRRTGFLVWRLYRAMSKKGRQAIA